MGATQLGIFAKHWRPGNVKTRLAADVGDIPAAEIYRHFIKSLLQRFETLADRSILSYSPPDQGEAFRHLSSGWQLEPQTEGNLGRRMQHYFQSAFAAGRQRVVLIGSDSPNLPVEFVQEAFEALNSMDVVLGPTRDGGFYLIGTRENCPDIFDDVPWSTPRVWEQTLQNIQRAKCSLTTLKPWYDIDELSDLLQLQNDLVTTSEHVLVELRDVLEYQLHALGRISE